MKTRLIDDPSSLGWEYDPDTGRWTWSGQGGSGDGGGTPFPEAPVDGNQYGRQDAGWTEIVSASGGIEEAPNDGKTYGRNSESWAEVISGGGGSGEDPRISNTDITDWSEAYSWGNHAGAGYLKDFDELDPTVPDHVKAITSTQISNWDSGTGGGGGNDPRISNSQISNWDTAHGWGNHSTMSYATQSWVNTQGYATMTYVSSNFQVKGSYATSTHNHNGVYAPASHTHSYAAVGASYTKAESDGRYEAKGGGGGAFVPLSGNSTITGTLTATDFIATSDERLKEDITQAPSGVLAGINGKEWNWKETGRKSAGVIAQELEDAGLGHLVHEDDKGFKAVAYNGLTAYLIEAVKELSARVKDLEGAK